MKKNHSLAFSALVVAVLAIASCGGGSDAGESGGETGGAEISGVPTPIAAAATCDLLTEADFGSALNGALVAKPDEGTVQSGCSWTDDDGALLTLAVTTFESADDLAAYQLDLESENTVDVAGYDVVAVGVGDFIAVGLADRYQVASAFKADDVADDVGLTAVTRWREASN